MTYLELVNVLQTELESYPFIERVLNDTLHDYDLDKFTTYPFAAFYMESVENRSNTNQYTFNFFIADILDVNKETDQDNRDFIWNQSILTANRLTSILRRGDLSDTPIEVNEPTFTPFTDRLDKGLAGIEFSLNIVVSNQMTIC